MLLIELEKEGDKLKLKEPTLSILFFIPAAIFLIAFFIYPIVLLVVDSFYQYDINKLNVKEFVGLSNYIKALTSDRFIKTTANTVLYVVLAVGIEFILGIILALLLSTGFRGSNIIRTLLLSPLMLAPLVAGLIWKFMLSDQFGIVNWTLYNIGILSDPHKVLWLSDERYSLISCAIADIWLTTPFMMLVLLAGIQGISKDLYEAAKIDGASRSQTFWFVTLPSLIPVATTAIIIRVIDAARSFDIIWVLTQGGPNFSSEILSTYMYKQLARYGRIGSASAMAVIFMIMLLAVSALFMKKIWNPNKEVN